MSLLLALLSGGVTVLAFGASAVGVNQGGGPAVDRRALAGAATTLEQGSGPDKQMRAAASAAIERILAAAPGVVKRVSSAAEIQQGLASGPAVPRRAAAAGAVVRQLASDHVFAVRSLSGGAAQRGDDSSPSFLARKGGAAALSPFMAVGQAAKGAQNSGGALSRAQGVGQTVLAKSGLFGGSLVHGTAVLGRAASGVGLQEGPAAAGVARTSFISAASSSLALGDSPGAVIHPTGAGSLTGIEGAVPVELTRAGGAQAVQETLASGPAFVEMLFRACASAALMNILGSAEAAVRHAAGASGVHLGLVDGRGKRFIAAVGGATQLSRASAPTVLLIRIEAAGYAQQDVRTSAPLTIEVIVTQFVELVTYPESDLELSTEPETGTVHLLVEPRK